MLHVFKIPAMKQIKVIEYRDVDYETAKKEVMGYFQERGEAYASEIEEDLELDYKLVCQIMDELKREGRLAYFDGMSRCRRFPSWLQNQSIGQEDWANGVCSA